MLYYNLKNQHKFFWSLINCLNRLLSLKKHEVVKFSGSEGSVKDKKNGAMTTKDYAVALNLLMLALTMFCSLF